MTLGEFAFIDQLLRPLAEGSPASLGLADDAAVLTPPAGRQLVLTKDAMVAGVHFLADDPPAAIAQKLLRVNLSDLAAMGADPLGYLLALVRPRAIDEDWLRAFVGGLAEDQREFDIAMLGGDTVSTPGPLTLSLTALGSVPEGQALRRNGGEAGDDLWVSGTLGDAAIGLEVLNRRVDVSAAASVFLIDRYRRPQPRLALGVRLRGLAGAAIDVSDGLLADLGHILEASDVGATVEADRVPLSPAAEGAPAAREAALTGGDDYELLFTAPERQREAILAIGREIALPVTRIGWLDAMLGLRTIDAQGRPVIPERTGWTHF